MAWQLVDCHVTWFQASTPPSTQNGGQHPSNHVGGLGFSQGKFTIRITLAMFLIVIMSSPLPWTDALFCALRSTTNTFKVNHPPNTSLVHQRCTTYNLKPQTEGAVLQSPVYYCITVSLQIQNKWTNWTWDHNHNHIHGNVGFIQFSY